MPRLPRHDLFRAILLAIRPGRHHELARQIEFLREENRILRSRLPRRVVVTPKERALLVRLGKPLGRAIDGLVSIVTPKTFARWASGATRSASETVAPKRPPGRPPVGSEIAELVRRMACETDWGYTRIHHELRKLGVVHVSRSSVANIVRAQRGPGGVPGGPSTWDQFIRAHAETLWACDFLSRKVWTARGLVEHFVLFFIHVGSRRVIVSPATANPDASWMAEQARRFGAAIADEGGTSSATTGSTSAESPRDTEFAPTSCPCKPSHCADTDEETHDDSDDNPRLAILLRDNDRKFTREFDETLRHDGVKPHPLPIQSPNLNAFAERWVQTVKRECLDHFVVFGSAHLDHLMREFVDYYHHHRPHQGLGGRTVEDDDSMPTNPVDPIEPRTRLGGRLVWYERRAA